MTERRAHRRHQQARELLDAIDTNRAALAVHVHTLIDRAAIAVGPDGWPTRSSTVPPGGQTYAPSHDDERTGPPGHGDPTGEAAVAHRRRDPAAIALRSVMSSLVAIDRELASAAQRCADFLGALPPPVNDVAWCTNPAHSSPEPRRPGGARYCRWCEDVVRATGGVLPDRQAMSVREHGKRLTHAHVDALMARARRPGRKGA